MKITLVDNAVDSLQVAMYALNSWGDTDNEKEERRYLKITIEFLHNTIELFLKALMVQGDEKSIYRDDQDELIRAAQIKALKSNVSLTEYLLKEDKIKTWSYSELLKKYFAKNTWYGNKSKKCLEKLGHYRNRIMHFGIDVNEDSVDILSTIYECFKIIIDDDFYNDLLKLTNYFSYNDVIDMVEPWIEEYDQQLKLLAVDIPKRKLDVFREKMEDVITSDRFKTFLKECNITVEDTSVYAENEIEWKFEHGTKKIKFITRYDAFYNCSTVIQDTYGAPMIFCVKHSEDKIYICPEWIEYDECEIESIYDTTNREKYKLKLLTENNVRNCIVDALKKTVLCDTWEPEKE